MSPAAAEFASAWSAEGDGAVGGLVVGRGGRVVGRAAVVVVDAEVTGGGALVWDPPQATSSSAAGATRSRILTPACLLGGPERDLTGYCGRAGYERRLSLPGRLPGLRGRDGGGVVDRRRGRNRSWLAVAACRSGCGHHRARGPGGGARSGATPRADRRAPARRRGAAADLRSAV